ncbi:MAG: 4-(cytidine 5'-diphospho)-2-C-methyl-D-erythritol kinase [Beijerinckiaceae bacterium]
MALQERAKAKVNLTLTVTGRRSDGYHTLESLVAFADAVSDTLTLTPGPVLSLSAAGVVADDAGPLDNNLALKAAQALQQRRAGLRIGHIHLEKTIPVAAGLGGGSADAAAVLRLLAQLNDLAPDDPVLREAARACGADVPVCLQSRACVMRGIGEIVSPPVHVGRLHALLVNPRVPCPTPAVFRALNAPESLAVATREDAPIARGWRGLGNDLQAPALRCVPVIADVLDLLARLPGCADVRMSGSGATCVGFFTDAAQAEQAACVLAARQPRWWIAATVLD